MTVNLVMRAIPWVVRIAMWLGFLLWAGAHGIDLLEAALVYLILQMLDSGIVGWQATHRLYVAGLAGVHAERRRAVNSRDVRSARARLVQRLQAMASKSPDYTVGGAPAHVWLDDIDHLIAAARGDRR